MTFYIAASENVYFDEIHEQIRDLFQNNGAIEIQEREKKLVLYWDKNKPLTNQELGRILLANGKCRNQGIHFVFCCPEIIRQQLSGCFVDRLLWVTPYTQINGVLIES